MVMNIGVKDHYATALGASVGFLHPVPLRLEDHESWWARGQLVDHLMLDRGRGLETGIEMAPFRRRRALCEEVEGRVIDDDPVVPRQADIERLSWLRPFLNVADRSEPVFVDEEARRPFEAGRRSAGSGLRLRPHGRSRPRFTG